MLFRSMRGVMRYLKYADDKDKIKEILHTYPEYQSLEKTVAQVIKVLTNTKVDFGNQYVEEEKVNMCKAIDDWMEEAKTEGRIEEQKNTARERKRADAAETRAKEAEKENQRLKLLLKEMGYCF